MIPNHIVLEACVDSLESAIFAEKNGAHQLELCSHLDVEGLTPDIDLIKAVRQRVDIPIKVMLRHRAGNFIYNSDDIRQLKKSLHTLRTMNIQGVVFGALSNDNTIDIKLTKEICKAAENIPVTFHKAIDLCNDIVAATIQLRHIGVDSILTSGGKDTAAEGALDIRQMMVNAGQSIHIIAAGKITSSNLLDIHQSIDGIYYHGQRIVGDL